MFKEEIKEKVEEDYEDEEEIDPRKFKQDDIILEDDEKDSLHDMDRTLHELED